MTRHFERHLQVEAFSEDSNTRDDLADDVLDATKNLSHWTKSKDPSGWLAKLDQFDRLPATWMRIWTELTGSVTMGSDLQRIDSYHKVTCRPSVSRQVCVGRMSVVCL